MSFAAPEPIRVDESKDCVKCGLHVKRTKSESWKVGKCPACWYNEESKIKINDNTIHSDPLLTIVKPALVNPFTHYLDKYTISEMRNMK